MSVEVALQEKFLDVSRAKILSSLPLESRISERIYANSWSKTGASFLIRAPSPTALMASDPRLYQRFRINHSAANLNSTGSLGSLMMRSDGLCRMITQCSIVLNGQTISTRPQLVGDVMHTLSKYGRSKDDTVQSIGEKYPFTGAVKTADASGGSGQVPVDSAAYLERGVNRKIQQLVDGDDPRVRSATTAHGMPFLAGNPVVDACYWTALPVAPLQGCWGETLSRMGCGGGKVIPHVNTLEVTLSYDTFDCARWLLRQTATAELNGCLSGDYPTTNQAGKFEPITQFDSKAVWDAVVKNTSAGAAGNGSNQIYAPWIEVDWYQISESAVNIPQAISLQGHSYTVFEQDFTFPVSQTSDQFKVSLSNLKFESMSPFLLIMAAPSIKQGNSGLGAYWNEDGSRMVDYFSPIDFDDCRVVVSTRQNVMSRPSRKLCFENFKQYLCPDCDISESEWFKYRCCMVLTPETFFQPANVYKPYTLSVDMAFRRAAFEYASVQGNTNTYPNTPYTMKIIAINPTAINLAPNSCSVSALRLSDSQYSAALGNAEE